MIKKVLTAVLTAFTAFGAVYIGQPAAAATTSLQAVELQRLPAQEAERALTDLLNDRDSKTKLEALIRHLNTSDTRYKLGTDQEPWRFGPLVPPGFQFTQSLATLKKVLPLGNNNSFVLYTNVKVSVDGKSLGQRPNKLYVFNVAGTRNAGRPYTAAIEFGMDLQTRTVLFVRSLVRQFASSDPLNIHEFTVGADGKVWRLSHKKSETLWLNVYSTTSGVSRAAAEVMDKRTLPNAQRASNMFEQARQLVITDPNANQNATITGVTTVTTSSKETSWAKIRNQLLETVKSAVKSLAESLLKAAREYLDQYKDQLVKALKDYVGGILSGILGGLF